jgi:hypothetical protein
MVGSVRFPIKCDGGVDQWRVAVNLFGALAVAPAGGRVLTRTPDVALTLGQRPTRCRSAPAKGLKGYLSIT